MTQEQDIVERLLDVQGENAALAAEAAQTIAALRAERDEMQKEVDLLRIDETGYQAVKEHLKARAEAAEAKVKQLEAQLGNSIQLTDKAIAAATTFKSERDIAIRERDELEAERARLWNENRELRATIDVEKAVADSCLRERDEAVRDYALVAQERDNLTHDLNKTYERLDVFRSERDELRKALEPFAKAADRYTQLVLSEDIDHFPMKESWLTLGDLRRASLASSNREGGE